MPAGASAATVRSLRIVDARRTWSRDYLEFDLGLLGRRGGSTVGAVGRRTRGCVLAATSPPRHGVTLSRHHGVQVCRALGAGVLDALEVLLERDSLADSDCRRRRCGNSRSPCCIASCFSCSQRRVDWSRCGTRSIATATASRPSSACLLEGRRYKGLWRAIQAISRLAHAGCTAGELRVTAFNGRLFAPAQAAAFDGTRLSDPVMSRTVLALSSTPSADTAAARRSSIAISTSSSLEPSTSGCWSTSPRHGPEPTDAHPRRAQVERLVLHASRGHDVSGSSHARTARSRPDGRRDPGASRARSRHGQRCVPRRRVPISGLGRRGGAHPGGSLARARRHTGRSVRRCGAQIASRCLFGVDLNPMAVQLARLSLWLATLAADKPLSFLDHHLVTGHSLVGATPEDLESPTRWRARPNATGTLRSVRRDQPSLDARSMRHRSCRNVSTEPDDSADIVRAKERTLQALQSRESSLSEVEGCARSVVRRLVLVRRRAPGSRCLPRPGRPAAGSPVHVAAEAGDGPAQPVERQSPTRHRFLHWPLTFPDVFSSTAQRPPGFDAMIGNPPWDMVRGDSGVEEDQGRQASRRASDDRLRSSVRHLQGREPRARQPVSALRRTRPSTRQAGRTNRLRGAVGPRQRRRRRTAAAASARPRRGR